MGPLIQCMPSDSWIVKLEEDEEYYVVSAFTWVTTAFLTSKSR